MNIFSDAQRLRAALQTVLDAVDYTRGACTSTEMVGGVLPKEVIRMARDVLATTKGSERNPAQPRR